MDKSVAVEEMEEKFGSLAYALEVAAVEPEQFSADLKNKDKNYQSDAHKVAYAGRTSSILRLAADRERSI